MPQEQHDHPRSQAWDDAHLVELWLYGKSEPTRDAYERDVRQFVNLIDRPLREMTLEDIQAWDGYLEEHYARNTRRRKLTTIKSLFSFGKTISYFLYNVGTSVQAPSAKDDLTKRILIEEEVQRIFALEERLRNRVMLRVYYVSGCRVSELVDLTWSQVIPREGKKGHRGGTPYARLMHPVVDRLTKEEMKAVAAYYASLKPEADSLAR